MFAVSIKVLRNLNCRKNKTKIFVGIAENKDEAKKVKDGATITVKYSGVNVQGTLLYPKFFKVSNKKKET
jgi:hypothetical protein